jgi:MGT family glycosyltransferase
LTNGSASLTDGPRASSVGSAPRLQVFLGAFGDPGHAFPMLALGAKLASRGHEVTFETWTRWRDDVEAAGIRFVAAPEYPVFPTRERPLKPYQAVLRASSTTRGVLRECAPDVVVHDILTLAPSLAAELEEVPAATLVPHLYPVGAPGLPPYSAGARMSRTRAGRALWRVADLPMTWALQLGRRELNETRARLGLPPLERLHGGLSTQLCIIGTFPQLEYPRRWSPEVHVVGPLMWEPPSREVPLPPGEDPLVLVAPSTAQDPEHELLRAALLGLDDEPIRLLAATNRKPLSKPVRVPSNAELVEWLSYSRAMPHCAVVITHAGHGTMARALASGCTVLAVPHSGDMGENAARAQWAGVGVRLPWRFLTPTTLRLALRRALADHSLGARARTFAAWSAAHDGAQRAAELVEALALSHRRGANARTR